MRQILLPIFLFFRLVGTCQPQSEEITRLKNLLLEKPDLINQTGIYNDLAWEYSNGNYDSALYYVGLASKSAEELGDPYWIAVSMEMLALLKEISGQSEEAIKLYFQVIPIRESIEGRGLENTYNNLAIIFRTQNNHEKAYEYFRQSYLIELRNDNKEGIAESLINMAITEKSLDRKDSLNRHLWEALNIGESIDNLRVEAYAMINLASLYSEEEKTDSAMYYYSNALTKSKALNDGSNEVVIKIGLAEIYTDAKRYGEALIHYEQAENIAEELHSIEYLQRIYAGKAKLYEKKRDFEKAYSFTNKSFVLRDSLTNIELVAQSNELERKFETEKKERQITQLQLASAEQKLMAEESKDQRRLLIFLTIILALGIWFVLYRNRKQKRTSLLLQSKNKTIAAALHDREILLKETHHRVKNNLQVVSSLLSIQGREIHDEKALEAVNESKQRVQSMALIHQYLYSEDDLESINMQQYIRQLCANLFNAYKLDHELVKLNVEVEPILLDVDTAVPLGIIINELVTNALKYAFPNNSGGLLTVSLVEENNKLNLCVNDNGIGKNSIKDSHFSFGMKLINAFKNKLKADLEIKTDNGYSVSFSIGNYKKT